MEARKQALIRFIERNYSDDDLERAQNLDSENEFNFDSYNEFKNFQRRMINLQDESFIYFLETVKSLIESKSLGQVDKEDTIEWDSDGFYFNKNNQLIITHPR